MLSILCILRDLVFPSFHMKFHISQEKIFVLPISLMAEQFLKVRVNLRSMSLKLIRRYPLYGEFLYGILSDLKITVFSGSLE